MQKRDKRMKPGVDAKLAAKVRAAGLRSAQVNASREQIASADKLAALRDEAAALGQYNAAVQAERIRAQIANPAASAGALDLAALDDATLRARLDAALSEIKRLAPRDMAQGQDAAPEMPDIFG